MTIQITSLAVTDATLSNRAALLAEQLNLELMLPDAEKAQLILTPNRL
ncbi:MAG TPA: 16S rRNA methyltransferase, partial [Methylophaga sp.]|nr:16S rRNA methyltransferase [Methylophaga sp.]